jgi:hypothetical protein
MAAAALAEGEREPEAGEHVDGAELVEPADTYRAETEISDESLDQRDGVALGPAPQQVGRGAVEVGFGEVLPAERVERPDEHGSIRAWLKSERGVEPPEDWDLFTIDIDALTVISVDNGQLLVDRWSTIEGRQTMRRA